MTYGLTALVESAIRRTPLCVRSSIMGSTGELNQFLMDIEKRAYQMALVSVKNSADALDIVQDVMLTLARKYANKPQDQWKPLFYKILRNRITDFHRSSTVRKRIFGWIRRGDEAEIQEDPIENSPGPESNTPDFQLKMDGIRTQLLEQVGALPARQQQAFVFRAWEGMDVKQTAQAMGCSQGSVKTHYSRALQALRKELEVFRDV